MNHKRAKQLLESIKTAVKPSYQPRIPRSAEMREDADAVQAAESHLAQAMKWMETANKSAQAAMESLKKGDAKAAAGPLNALRNNLPHILREVQNAFTLAAKAK